jgi:hypothetical protein
VITGHPLVAYASAGAMKGRANRVGRWCALGADGAGGVDWGVRGFVPGGGDLMGGGG